MSEPNNKPRPVGFVVPCYNHGKYTADCIDSILKQDYTHKAIVIVDNGSSDNSFEQILSYLKTLGNLEKIVINNTEFVKTQKNNTLILATSFTERLGAAGGRNVGIAALFGIVEYFLFLDIDDILNDKNIISSMVSVLDSYPEVGLVYGDYEILDEKTGNCWREHKETYSLVGLQRDCFINTPLIRKSSIEKVGMFDKELDGQEDYDMWIRICELYMAYHIPISVLKARHSEMSTYDRVSPAKYQMGIKKIIEKMQARRGG